jgi:hypothetical protein
MKGTGISDNTLEVASYNRRGGGEMMKKLVLVGLLALLVAGSASAANYLWNVNSTDTDGVGLNYGPQARMGVRTVASAVDQTMPSNWLAYAGVLNYTGTLGAGMVKTNLYSTSYVVSPPTADPGKYILQVWGGSAYGMSTMDVRIWASTAVNSKPSAGWRLYKLYDPISGVWGRTELTTGDITGATVGSQASPWFKVNLPMSGNAKTDTPLVEGKGYILELSVPEPGSMVAMLSGLVGLVGFGIRRRR